MTESLRWQFKVCLIGEGYVGKTSIRRKYLGNTFKTNYIPTLGVDFAQKTMALGGSSVLLVIWDIAGQPLFRGLRKRYYEGCAGMILTYSVVDRDSFDNASKWLVEAHEFLGELPPLIIAGNKVDLRPTYPPEQTVSYQEGEQFAEMFGEKLDTPAIFIETSALTGENIDEAFHGLVKLMIGEESLAVAQAEHVPTDESAITLKQVELGDDQAAQSVSGAEFVQEAEIGRAMTELVDLKGHLKTAESELAEASSELEKKLFNLKNTIHVKRIMYEHLKTQLLETRQEWSDAYDEYVKTDKRRKSEVAEREKRVEELRKRVEQVEKTIGKQIRDLNLEVRD